MSGIPALKSLLNELQIENGTPIANDFIEIITGLLLGTISKVEGQSRLSNPKFGDPLIRLSGKTFHESSGVISFGDESNLGDVTIRDIAGGNITRLNVPVQIKSSQQNVTIGQQNNIYYINPNSTNWPDISPPAPFNLNYGTQSTVEIVIENGNILRTPTDIVVLKFAKALYGADELVARVLGQTEADIAQYIPQEGKYIFLATQNKLSSPEVLFYGTQDIGEFEYKEIRLFSSEILAVLAKHRPNVRNIAMTIHGVGYGLDENEALKAQIAGFFDAFASKMYPKNLGRITIVEVNADRANRLRATLQSVVAGRRVTLPGHTPILRVPEIENAGTKSEFKPHILAVLSSSEDLDDIYYYGIQAPVNAAGYLCERVVVAQIGNEAISRVRSRIETASLIITDLSVSDTKVYLTLGYVLGRDKNVMLIRRLTTVTQDDFGKEIIQYSKIKELEEKVAKELKLLKA